MATAGGGGSRGRARQMLDERMHKVVSSYAAWNTLAGAFQRIQPERAGKITGMLLEMDDSELLLLLDSKDDSPILLNEKIGEFLKVLEVPRRFHRPGGSARLDSAGRGAPSGRSVVAKVVAPGAAGQLDLDLLRIVFGAHPGPHAH